MTGPFRGDPDARVAEVYGPYVGRPAHRPPCPFAIRRSLADRCRGRHPRRPAEGSRPLPTMQTSNRRRRRVAGRACPAPTGWWMVGGCWPGGAGGIYAAPYGQAYCNIRIPDKHHYTSKEVLPAPLSFFVVSCYNILCIVMYKIYRERYLFITYAAFEKL